MDIAPRSRWGWKAKLLASVVALFALSGLGYWWQLALIESYYAEMRSEGWPTNSTEVQESYKISEGVVDSTHLWVPAIENATVAIKAVTSPEHRLPYDDDIPPVGQPWDRLEEIAAILPQLAPQLEAIHRASEVGGQALFHEDFDGSSTDVLKLLGLEAAVAAHQGDSVRCHRALLACFALANSGRANPDMGSYLITTALREISERRIEIWLPSCQWTDEELRSLQQVLCEVDLRTEFSISFAADCPEAMEVLGELRLFPFRTANELAMLRHFSEARMAMKFPFPMMIEEFGVIDIRRTKIQGSRISQWTLSGFLQFAPPLESYGLVLKIHIARQACLNAVLAAERFRLRHGQWPISLAAIDADLFGHLPDGTVPLTDPFNGQPLRFNVREMTLLIYSIGKNETDDGGEIAFSLGSGFKDIGFKLVR